ncbi:MAG TPA: hypothetical protein VJ770_09310 [Stellaceae bacterium]|nr:hypothetical protein [Stellaceae bacterium]
MAKIVKFPRSRLPAEAEPAIARLREIAAEAWNRQLLTGDPPHPDAELLDLCAEVLHLMKRAEWALKEFLAMHRPDSWDLKHPAMQAFVRERDHLHGERASAIGKAKPLMSRIRKMRATTAVGIYAKALVVRSSRTAAPMLAMSLAEDLIANSALRASLWPAEREVETGEPA